MAEQQTTNQSIETLLASGALVRCAGCGELSSFSWQHVTHKQSYPRLCWQPGEIAHIGAASGFEWECGHCAASNVPLDSPLLAEVFTHVDPAELTETTE